MSDHVPGVLESRGRKLIDTPFGRRIVKPLASLKLTVALFVLSILLVFFGTLAQIDEGIWTVVEKYFRNGGFVWVPLQLLFPRSIHVPGAFPFPGGWMIGAVLLANLLAAHAIRFKLDWKRSGIFLIHAGLIVLLLSEVVTGRWAIEGHMTIEEGRSSNYVEQNRKIELAVVDPSDPASNQVTTIPHGLLRTPQDIRHEALPFDITVVEYMVNSTLKDASSFARNPATAGEGVRWVAMAAPEISGTDTKQRMDAPSVYVTLRNKRTAQTIGTYLVSLWFDDPQEVDIEGKKYTLELRFKRSYKPYTLHLIEFRHDKYIGTETPKNFSSQIRLVDPEQKIDREVLIYMNHPLRHAGETFYQADFRGDSTTILQVVRNPGWLLPYVSCLIVSVGLIVQFVLSLLKFLRKEAAA